MTLHQPDPTPALAPGASVNGATIASTNPSTASTPNKPAALAHEGGLRFRDFHHGTMHVILQPLHAGQDRAVAGEEVVDAVQEEVGLHIGGIGKMGAG